MRIGFVVNDVQTEKAQYTTTRLAMSATRMGHEAWVMGVGDFAHRADGSVGARARSTSGKKFKSLRPISATSRETKPRRRRSQSTSSTC